MAASGSRALAAVAALALLALSFDGAGSAAVPLLAVTPTAATATLATTGAAGADAAAAGATGATGAAAGATAMATTPSTAGATGATGAAAGATAMATTPSTAGTPGAAAASATASVTNRKGPLVLGYYVPYDTTSWNSLQAHADEVDLVGAQWVTTDGCGGLASTDDQTLKAFAEANGIRVVPSLLTSGYWLNHQLLTDETARANAIQHIVEYTLAENYAGFDLDLEGVNPDDRDALSAFVADTAAALHAQQKLLTLAIPAKVSDVTVGWAGAYDYAALGAVADLITVMAYEYRGPFSGPGSVAPFDWVQRVAAFASSQIPPSKLLLGLAFYGYDWNTTGGGSRSVGYPRAATLADFYAAQAQFDAAQQSLTFTYTAVAGDPTPPDDQLRRPAQHTVTTRSTGPCDVVPPPTPPPSAVRRPLPEPGTPQEHQVWVEDSTSAAARLDLVGRYGLAGVGTWRLGQEDPGVWPLFATWRTT